jgi:hypothetical protein
MGDSVRQWVARAGPRANHVWSGRLGLTRDSPVRPLEMPGVTTERRSYGIDGCVRLVSLVLYVSYRKWWLWSGERGARAKVWYVEVFFQAKCRNFISKEFFYVQIVL